MASSIEIEIRNQKYTLRGEETEEHLREVAELVRRKVENLTDLVPSAPPQKIAMLAAFDFASQAIKGRRKALDYRATLLNRAQQLLEKVEHALASRFSVQ
jgi:cell division protein ZapA (FtsZ GTPase activity inhibitor)